MSTTFCNIMINNQLNKKIFLETYGWQMDEYDY